MGLFRMFRCVVTAGRGLKHGLPIATADRSPIDIFGDWFAVARDSGILHPNSMSVATVDANGAPSVRMLLLKGHDGSGFVFFTNYESRKAQEMESNPKVALCFHWAVLERQVRIEGTAERISKEESSAYFSTRPQGSRIGAWASRQSEPLDRRETLEARFDEVKEKYAGEEIPLPPFWGGYRVLPERIEFWQGRLDRLHDRLVFTRQGTGWSTQRLYP
jgi:pyridoxamine 5'-phosphate oxidase